MVTVRVSVRARAAMPVAYGATGPPAASIGNKFMLHSGYRTVPSRQYRRRQAHGYRQDLMYLSMVICICISVFAIDYFEMPVPFRCEILA